ncbi:WAPL domain-containing protein [Trichonephila inaurata madagascariensis]|uniref:WAPL domain-containing protein n=1 Tax=Trichonephila inaurata madagascariensis TaxID=2747483 RepID=A0A8X6YSM4_9ARAC|nr:WAPL domain-containing protein [Trichonephila inaurata madagascariensis]
MEGTQTPMETSTKPKYERKCEREFRKLLESDQKNIRNLETEKIQVSVETSNEPKYERKCEREFRKLLESGTSQLIICKKECFSSENTKKKFKNDEISEGEDSSLNAISCFSTFQRTTSKNPICVEISKPDEDLASAFVKNKENIDLKSLSKLLNQQNSLETRHQSAISLAVFCSENLSNTQLSTILDALHLLSNSHESDILSISHSLLLLTLTKNALNLDQIIFLEEKILKLANSVMLSTNELGNKSFESRLGLLRGEEYLTAFKLCRQLFLERNIDIDALDVLTLCCSSLRNLSSNKVGEKYKYKPSTLNFVLGMTGKATQEIVSENLIEDDDEENSCNIVSASSHMVNQCLEILQHMLTVDPDLPCRTLDHEDFSLLHCLTRLFGWCMSFLFQKDQSENNCQNVEKSSSFHLTTLISILKILSILSFNPDQYDSFTNIKGLMEKVMICILKTYYQSSEKHFDVLVLALELMINFFLKNKKTFVLLCLKKFQISGCEHVHSIEALLKILANSLDKINEIKQKSLDLKSNNDQSQTDGAENLEEDDMKLVLEAADEDMELSTIVSFISILLAFFMDTKVGFVDFIRERLTSEKCNEAITVSKKVLQFASITGGMPATGILLLRHAIRKLSRLYPAT